MAILVTGGSGQLGRELRALGEASGVRIVAPDRRALDLAATEDIERWVAAESWDAVINAAAYTAVDRAESEPDLAFRINAEAPGHLAAATARRGIALVHVSTDYVFDGTKGAPYLPSDPVAPLGVYGASKERGERAVRAANPRHVVLRTAWVYSPFGSNFVRTMLRLGAERDTLRVVDDQRGSPTSARDLAAACLAVAARLSGGADAPFGTYHYTGSGETTWCGFARAIFDLAAADGRRTPAVVPITTAEYPTAARRPADSRLDCRDTIDRFAVVCPPWRAALAAVLARLQQDETTP